MSKCFIINEPLRYNPVAGCMTLMFDLTSAQEYGELVYVLPRGNNPPDDLSLVLPTIKAAMRGFTARDYIVAVGHVEMISWASALAAQATDGIVNLLKWSNRSNRYTAMPARLW